MLINADFTRRAALAPEHYQWVPSPQNGVERVMLDRVGAEKARATSIVRYATESYFPHHMPYLPTQYLSTQYLPMQSKAALRYWC